MNYFYLDHNHIGDDGGIIIAQCLTNNTVLTNLQMGNFISLHQSS